MDVPRLSKMINSSYFRNIIVADLVLKELRLKLAENIN